MDFTFMKGDVCKHEHTGLCGCKMFITFLRNYDKNYPPKFYVPIILMSSQKSAATHSIKVFAHNGGPSVGPSACFPVWFFILMLLEAPVYAPLRNVDGPLTAPMTPPVMHYCNVSWA